MDTDEKSPVLSLQKLGVNYGKLILYAVLQELSYGPSSALPLYDSLKGEIAGKKFSRKHFYERLAEMEQVGFIRFVGKDAQKKLYEITEKGRAEYKVAYDKYYPSFSSLLNQASVIRYDINRRGNKPEIKPISTADRRFFGRIANVFNIIAYFALTRLREEHHARLRSEPVKRMIAKDIQNEIGETYGWKPSHGHFYDVMHRLEVENEWIHSKWDDDKKRSRRFFEITDRGLQIVELKAQDVEHEMGEVILFLRSVLRAFDRNV
ncbi:PadR family transcriptional regulator [Aneurinibacillus tyrosinisolvens]|uniref:PadR family transcriptional regulator n=1 Tax=Aneurinibacillus tyrosinisolvens TaxID=1443435 RepID=UPI00063F4EE7|nr:helix-turn-helix transcriptional regulator [Aneurinibacillus tyrosinisolvens]